MDPPEWHRTSYNVEGTRGVDMDMIKVFKDWNVKDTFAALALQKLELNNNDTTRGFGARYGSQCEKSRNRYFRVDYMTLKFRERIAKIVKLQKIAQLENLPEDVGSAVKNCTW